MDHMEFEEEIQDKEYFEEKINSLVNRADKDFLYFDEKLSVLEERIKELKNRPTTIKIIDASGQCIHLTLPLASYKEKK